MVQPRQRLPRFPLNNQDSLSHLSRLDKRLLNLPPELDLLPDATLDIPELDIPELPDIDEGL